MTLLLPEAMKTMDNWVEAFTATLEIEATAAADEQMRRDMQKRADSAKKDASRTNEESDHKAALDQQHIVDCLPRFDLEAHRELMAQWRVVAQAMKNSGFSLSEDINFDILGEDRVLLTQGKSLIAGNGLKFNGQHAIIAKKFLEFVYRSSGVVDPLIYTRNALARQGIHNSEQFEAWKKHNGSGMRNPFAG
jgi:hypothetical protein